MTREPSICLATFRYPPMAGGVAHAAARLAKMLPDERLALHVCVFAEKHEPVETGEFVHRIEIPSEAQAPLERAMAMHSGLRGLDALYGFDLFHGFFLPSAQPCLQATAHAPRPVIASSRGSDATLWLQDSRRRQTIETVLRRAHWITAVSHDSLRRLGEVAAIEGRSTVIPNSVGEEAFAGGWRNEPRSRGVVGTVAEFHPVKQIPLLIEAYAALPRALRRKLLLVGGFANESERIRILAAINREGIGEEVEITGHVDAACVRDHLRRMRVFVQCSAAEGFSNALLEAAAGGLPIVATPVGGVEELLRARGGALSTAAPDRASLTEAIAALLEDDRLAESRSEAARAAARSFTPERERTAWRDIYNRLLSATAPAFTESVARTKSASGENGRRHG